MTDQMEIPTKAHVLGLLDAITGIITRAQATGYITTSEMRQYFEVNKKVISRVAYEDEPIAVCIETEEQRIERERIMEYIGRKGAPVLSVEITALIMNTTIFKIQK